MWCIHRHCSRLFQLKRSESSPRIFIISTMEFIFASLLFLLTFIPCHGQGSDKPPLQYELVEEMPEDSFIGNIPVDAYLKDVYPPEDFAQLTYQFLGTPPIGFKLQEDTGVLRTSGKVDRDKMCPNQDECQVKIDVAIQPMKFFLIVKVFVEIKDKNDNAPTFTEKEVTHQILESAVKGTSFVILPATDPDAGLNGIQRYALDGAAQNGKFELQVTDKIDGAKDVRLVLKSKLDREESEEYYLKVVAFDGGIPPKSGTCDVKITVQDANDNHPIFENETYEASIEENTPAGTSIVRVKAHDSDAGMNGKIAYSFATQTLIKYGSLFKINNSTGEITIRGSIDYEASPVYHLSVIAKDLGPDSLPADTTVIVRVLDINDNMPQIKVRTLRPSSGSGNEYFDVEEDVAVDTFLAHITVSDPDSGENGECTCDIDSSQFVLRKQYDAEYVLKTKTRLDRESTPRYDLNIKCKDKGTPSRTAIETLHITVTDINDNAPYFSQNIYKAELEENKFLNEYVTTVSANDKDQGTNAQILYGVENKYKEYFAIDLKGRITTKRIFDRESTPKYQFEVYAMDKGTPSKTGTARVVIDILDINDEKPEFNAPTYSFGVLEDEPPGTNVGMVGAIDKDLPPNNQFSYSIAHEMSSDNTFAIDSKTGQITTKVKLDREAQSVYYLIVEARDDNDPPMSSTASVSIYITDKNDNPPTFVFPTKNNNSVQVSNKIPVDYIITRVKAKDPDSEANAEITYEITDGNREGYFKVEAVSGSVILRSKVDHLKYQEFALTLSAKDHGSPSPQMGQSKLVIAVNHSIPYFPKETSLLGGHNFTIVISLACVSGVVAVILIIAIVVIYRHWDREEKKRRYNCRMEALRVLTTKDMKDDDGGMTNKDNMEHTTLDIDREKQEVSYRLAMDEHSDDPSDVESPKKMLHSPVRYVPTPSKENHNNHQSRENLSNHQKPSPNHMNGPNPAATNAKNPKERHVMFAGPPIKHPPPGMKQPNGTGHHPTPAHQAAGSWNLSQQELEDQDSDSAYSGEGSNTDSGRGPSEEGTDHRHLNGHHPTHNGHHPPHNGHHVQNNEQHHPNHNGPLVPHHPGYNGGPGRPLDPSNPMNDPKRIQTLPNPRRMGGQQNYAYPPSNMYTFNPRTSNYSDPKPDLRTPRLDNLNLIDCSSKVTQPSSRFQGPPRPVRIVPGKSEPPPATISNAPINPRGGNLNTLNNHHGNPNARSHRTSFGSLLASDKPYMDPISEEHSHHNDSTTNLSDATTTSGSYTVDPQDLCNEIDNLFFKSKEQTV